MQQLSMEVLHSNRLELLLPLLQPFLFQIRFSGKGGWKNLSSSWEEAKDEQSLQLLIFQVKSGKHRGKAHLGQRSLDGSKCDFTG